jgi:hypothetical protein
MKCDKWVSGSDQLQANRIRPHWPNDSQSAMLFAQDIDGVILFQNLKNLNAWNESIHHFDICANP